MMISGTASSLGELFHSILESTADGLLVTDHRGTVQVLSRAGLAMLDLQSSDLEAGLNLFDFIHPRDRQRARRSFLELLGGAKHGFVNYRVLRRDGSSLVCEAAASLLRASDGSPERFLVIFRDITAREREHALLRRRSEALRALNSELRSLALLDPLTGVGNRRAFQARLQHEIHRTARFHKPFCLLMFDIDHFKRINDQHGHPAGDAVLSTLASSLGLHIRQVDGLFRIGGEEFAVILTETPLEQGLMVADYLRSLTAELGLQAADGALLSVTISLGVASSDQVQGLDVDRISAAADRALYAAKAAGRNCVAACR